MHGAHASRMEFLTVPFSHAGKMVSPWHEIPLYAGDGCLHYICEIPKETSAKMEVATVGGRARSHAGRA